MKISQIMIKFVIAMMSILFQQVVAQEQEIDASKPTNFYSFIDNILEY